MTDDRRSDVDPNDDQGGDEGRPAVDQPGPRHDRQRGTELEELDRPECERLLRSAAVGRIAVARDERPPLVVPVNYTFTGAFVVVRTGPGTKLDAMRVRPVTFQIDAIDPLRRTGWSVMVEGEVQLATRGAPPDGDVDTWSTEPSPFYARIVPTAISGRRIRLPEAQLDGRDDL